MIIIHVMGGLGNQLYQYAMYEKLKMLGKEVKLDLYDYKEAVGEDREWRDLELDYFEGLAYDVCSLSERTVFLDNSRKFFDRVRRKLFGRKDRIVRETESYMPELFDMDNVYLHGFWNSEKYYEDMIPELWQKIVFPPSSNEKNISCINEMENINSVAIHIRRSDYLKVADGKRYMGICTDEYYKAAMDYIEKHVENPVYYIFSDDEEYAREHFCNDNMKIVYWNKGKDSFYDMQLMSCCKHNICANSTFSLWGARLNTHPDKIMIRPLRHDNYDESSPDKIKEEWNKWVLIDKDGRLI